MDWTAKDELIEIKGMLQSLTDTIKGNGKISLLTRVSNSELKIKLLLWVVGVQAVSVCGLVGRLVYNGLT